MVPKYHLLDIVPKYHLLDIVPKYHLLFKRRFFSLVHRSHWLIFAIQFSLFGFPAFCVLLCFCVYVVSVSGLSSSCVLCAQCCQCFWIVFVLCLMCPMLSVFLDYLRPVSYVPNVVSVSGLSILDCPFYNVYLLQKISQLLTLNLSNEDHSETCRVAGTEL